MEFMNLLAEFIHGTLLQVQLCIDSKDTQITMLIHLDHIKYWEDLTMLHILDLTMFMHYSLHFVHQYGSTASIQE